jgi:hypothetical protein
MQKTNKNMVKTQAAKTPSRNVDRLELDKQLSDLLAQAQVASTANIPSGEHERTLVEASKARYREFAPVDATERLLTMLSVGLQNAAMTSLQVAAHTDAPQMRTEELKNATRVARAVMDLLGALDKRRGRNNQRVTVGQVTVEPGAQAVVGNVHCESQPSNKPEEAERVDKAAAPQKRESCA